ncbi:hypothetical protein JZ751_020119 [Albula glossodonta]|uniref:Uncharacterized protein n=1 Tax=Albula glossodonta TaxID=121402 RepID=A0A8T2NMQ3_9TELE|nr:hypothetical protein JZ751_020119 [Albula glossodonta]
MCAPPSLLWSATPLLGPGQLAGAPIVGPVCDHSSTLLGQDVFGLFLDRPSSSLTKHPQRERALRGVQSDFPAGVRPQMSHTNQILNSSGPCVFCDCCVTVSSLSDRTLIVTGQNPALQKGPKESNSPHQHYRDCLSLQELVIHWPLTTVAARPIGAFTLLVGDGVMYHNEMKSVNGPHLSANIDTAILQPGSKGTCLWCRCASRAWEFESQLCFYQPLPEMHFESLNITQHKYNIYTYIPPIKENGKKGTRKAVVDGWMGQKGPPPKTGVSAAPKQDKAFGGNEGCADFQECVWTKQIAVVTLLLMGGLHLLCGLLCVHTLRSPSRSSFPSATPNSLMDDHVCLQICKRSTQHAVEQVGLGLENELFARSALSGRAAYFSTLQKSYPHSSSHRGVSVSEMLHLTQSLSSNLPFPCKVVFNTSSLPPWTSDCDYPPPLASKGHRSENKKQDIDSGKNITNRCAHSILKPPPRTGRLLPLLLPQGSQVKAEGPEVAGGVVGVDSGGGGHRDENLIASAKLEQTALVHRMKGVLCVWGPALGPYTLQQLDGLTLVAGSVALPLTGRRVTEVHLCVQEVTAVAGNPQVAAGEEGHVVECPTSGQGAGRTGAGPAGELEMREDRGMEKGTRKGRSGEGMNGKEKEGMRGKGGEKEVGDGRRWEKKEEKRRTETWWAEGLCVTVVTTFDPDVLNVRERENKRERDSGDEGMKERVRAGARREINDGGREGKLRKTEMVEREHGKRARQRKGAEEEGRKRGMTEEEKISCVREDHIRPTLKPQVRNFSHGGRHINVLVPEAGVDQRHWCGLSAKVKRGVFSELCPRELYGPRLIQAGRLLSLPPRCTGENIPITQLLGPTDPKLTLRGAQLNPSGRSLKGLHVSPILQLQPPHYAAAGRGGVTLLHCVGE